MVVILGDGSRNSIGGTAFHEVDHPGTKNINDLQDYRSAKDNEKKLQDLYEEMGIHKAEEDDESQAIADLILEQQGILEDYRKQFDMEELKFLSSKP